MPEDYPTKAKQRKYPVKEIAVTADLARRFAMYAPEGAPGECWEWTSYKNPKGYGTMWDGKRLLIAARVAYALANGGISPSLLVRHICDNPPCVNPAHLLNGTAQDNTDDATERLRHKYGEKHPSHKLTADQVIEIRALWAAKELTATEIAARYGVSGGLICSVGRGAHWRHLPSEPIDRVLRGEASPNAKLTDARVREIRRLASEGVSYRALARQFGVSMGVAQRVARGETWKHAGPATPMPRRCPKLTEDDIREIRRFSAGGETGLRIAARFSVTASAISCILKGKTWSQVK